MRTLNLNVSHDEFQDVYHGRLGFIYHTTGMLWSRILQGKQFDIVLVKHTCPKSGAQKITACRWRGYEIRTVASNAGPLQVYAIRVGVAL